MASEGTRSALESLNVERFSCANLRKACAALHCETMMVIGLQIKDKHNKHKVLKKQLDKLIAETAEDLSDADFEPMLLAEARETLEKNK